MERVARAAIYEAPNTPFVIKQYPVRPARAGEALVRVTMSTICRSDIHSYEGRRPNPVPGILGHEIVGVLEEIGAGVERDLRGDPLRAGDRVTWTGWRSRGPAARAWSSVWTRLRAVSTWRRDSARISRST